MYYNPIKNIKHWSLFIVVALDLKIKNQETTPEDHLRNYKLF